MTPTPRSGVYIIHFDRPFHHARHYVGYADDILRRFGEHACGTGAKLTRAVLLAGIHFQLSRIFPRKGRTFERKLKRTNNTADYCPICNPNPRTYHPKGE